MKKVLTILCALLLVSAIAGCEKEETVIEETEVVEEEPMLAGGWSDESIELDEELTAIFESAMEGYEGATYTPVKLIGRQVVAGTNYRFLAEETTEEGITSLKLVTIYEDLKGNTEVLFVSDYEDTTEVEMVGGWIDNEMEMNDELMDIFTRATEGLDGAAYMPIRLLGTQVVAGTNYRFLAEVTAVTPEAETARKIVTIYEDLEGNVEVTGIEDYIAE